MLATGCDISISPLWAPEFGNIARAKLALFIFAAHLNIELVTARPRVHHNAQHVTEVQKRSYLVPLAEPFLTFGGISMRSACWTGRSHLLSSWLPSLSTNALAFGAASFSSSILITLNSLYITDVFTSVYKIEDSHFYASHVIFAIWNALNDPMFAWLIDNTAASGADRRLPAIKYGGPLWCLAFLIPWWPWSNVEGSLLVGVHFCFSICMFDSFLTYVLLVHCALLADLTTDNTARNNYNNVGNLLGVFGGAAGAASYYLYDGKDMSNFRMFCLCAAAVSSVGFWWTGTRLDVGRLETFKRQAPEVGVELQIQQSPLREEVAENARSLARKPELSAGLRPRSPATKLDDDEETDPLLESTTDDGGRGAAGGARVEGDFSAKVSALTPASKNHPQGGRELSFWGFAKQLSSHANFWLYVSMNFVENFNALFDQSFFLFLDTKLFEQTLPTGVHAVLTSLSLYLPKIMVQVLTPVADRYGTYRLMMWAATFKLVAGSLMLCTAGRMWPLWALLFLGNRLAQTVWGFYNLSFADVIDEDTLRNRRHESMSVSVHGVQALFVKPAQSLAPMLGMAFLPKGALKTDLALMPPQQSQNVKAAAFTIMCAVPTVCGLVQVLIWRSYSLHGAALKDMKRRVREWESQLSNEGETSSKLAMA